MKYPLILSLLFLLVGCYESEETLAREDEPLEFYGYADDPTLDVETLYTEYVDPKIGSGGHGHVFVGANVPFGAVQLGPTSVPEDWDWTSGYHDSDQSVIAEMTSTERVGFSRYTFPESEQSAIVFDLENGSGWDDPTQTYMREDGDNRIVGFRYSTGWANTQRVYFVAEFSQPFESFEVMDKNSYYARASFPTTAGQQILVKVAISSVSIEGAEANMEEELPGWDFDVTAQNAITKWDSYLSRIKVTGASEQQQRIFYTALYHTMIAPSLFSDVDGGYFGADHQQHVDEEYDTYTTFSLWDTYRAAHPLMSLIHYDKMADIINSMVKIHYQQGWLPVWHLMGNETNTMIGNPGVIVVADAITKDIEGVDMALAWEAVRSSAMRDDRGQSYRKPGSYGYIPNDLEEESVAKDMEYAIADGAVARAAQKLGFTVEEKYFTERS